MIEKLVKLTKEQKELLSLIDKNKVPSHVYYDKSIDDLMKESKEYLVKINNFFEKSFDLSSTIIQGFKQIVNPKYDIYYKKSECSNKKTIKKREYMTPEHVHKYLSILYKKLKWQVDLVENNKRINPDYNDNKQAKLELPSLKKIITFSFNESGKNLKVSYSTYYKKNISLFPYNGKNKPLPLIQERLPDYLKNLV